MRLNKYSFQMMTGLFLIFAMSTYLSGNETSQPKKAIATNVSVTEIKHENVTETFHLSGVVIADLELSLASELNGKVETLHAKEGNFINQGDLILKLDSQLLEAQKKLIHARYSQAQKTLQRISNLSAKKLISEEELDQNKTAVAVLEAEMNQIDIQLDKSVIKSPKAGFINQLNIEEGEILGAGIPFLNLVNIDLVEVQIDVPEKDIFFINKDDQVTLSCISFPEKKLKGKVTFIPLKAETPSRTFPIKVQVSNDDHFLKAGMLIECHFTKPPKSNQILISQTALLSKEGRKWVFLVENGHAQEKEVLTGPVQEGRVPVLKGLHPGDKLITFGQNKVIDGDPVKVVANPFKEIKE